MDIVEIHNTLNNMKRGMKSTLQIKQNETIEFFARTIIAPIVYYWQPSQTIE
jgi:hypothetical protein